MKTTTQFQHSQSWASFIWGDLDSYKADGHQYPDSYCLSLIISDEQTLSFQDMLSSPLVISLTYSLLEQYNGLYYKLSNLYLHTFRPSSSMASSLVRYEGLYFELPNKKLQGTLEDFLGRLSDSKVINTTYGLKSTTNEGAALRIDDQWLSLLGKLSLYCSEICTDITLATTKNRQPYLAQPASPNQGWEAGAIIISISISISISLLFAFVSYYHLITNSLYLSNFH